MTTNTGSRNGATFLEPPAIVLRPLSRTECSTPCGHCQYGGTGQVCGAHRCCYDCSINECTYCTTSAFFACQGGRHGNWGPALSVSFYGNTNFGASVPSGMEWKQTHSHHGMEPPTHPKRCMSVSLIQNSNGTSHLCYLSQIAFLNCRCTSKSLQILSLACIPLHPTDSH